jgi:hypothetical protein
MPEIIKSRVIPCDAVWGVAIRYSDRRQVAYQSAAARMPSASCLIHSPRGRSIPLAMIGA